MIMQDRKHRILFVEDDNIDIMAFERFVKTGQFPYSYVTAGSAKEASDILESDEFDAVVLDYFLGDGTAFDLFDRIDDTPIIIVTGIGDEKIAVRAMKSGAYDYLVKDSEGRYLEVLPATLEKAINHKEAKDELKRYREHLEDLVKERTAELRVEITEHKKTEEQLRESEEQYRSLVQTASDAIVSVDSNMNIVFWNGAAGTMFGYSEDEILGRSLINLIPERYRGSYREGMKEMALSGEASSVGRSIEFPGLRSDGSEFPAEISIAAWKTRAGMFFTSITRDMTERKLMEEELLKVQKLESIGILAGGIAHDLNNLLTGVMGNIALARLYENIAEKDDRLAEAEKASMRIQKLTQQLLTFSKGGVPILKIAIIGHLLEESASFALHGSNVRCEFSIPDSLWPVEIDEGQINQVINNLVINSQQAMPGGGTVRISAENITMGAESNLPLEQGSYIKVSVEDQGIGISEEHIQKIFDPFFTTKQEGNGLGLATSYSIIEKHKGYITVESRIGVGTTFHIYLPALAEEVLIKEEKGQEKPIIGEGKILVMDDEKHVRDISAEMLSSLGYEVITSIDGAEAIEIYRQAMGPGKPFDAVILDLTIPGGIGGKKTIQKLREIDPEVKGIVSSGYHNDPVMAHFREHGFRSFITKPYRLRELSEVLYEVLTAKAQYPI